MTILIGVILLAVFLCFAVLMFLERLSALLALPLMAVAFLLIAVGADLIQPASVVEITSRETVDQFGRRQITVAEEPASSRFECWKQVRLRQAEILRGKAALLSESVDTLETELTRVDDTLARRLADALAAIRIAENQFRKRAYETLDALPDFFARPPHYAGQRARFNEAFDAIAISESLKPIATLLDRHSAGEAVPKIREILEGVSAQSQQFTERYAAIPDPQSTRFRLISAAAYLLEYLMLVVRAGSLHLYAAIIATVFGGMFAMYVKNLRVAERLVYWTAEFAGERPFIIALAVFLVTAGIFTSVGGLGTVIMLGTIILPILRSVGLGPIVAAGTFLIAIAMGGTLQPVARGCGWSSTASRPHDWTRSCGRWSGCTRRAGWPGSGGARGAGC